MNGPEVTRRRLLQLMAAGAASGVAATLIGGCSGSDRATSPSPSKGARPKPEGVDPAAAERSLVIIELGGGNDGLSTLVPWRNDTYRKLRPTLALDEPDLVEFDDEFGLDRTLAPLGVEGLAVLAGVGCSKPSMSHFDMIARWWGGTPDPAQGWKSGFLGRLSDAVAGGGGIGGVSIGRLASPTLRTETGSTIGLRNGSLVAGLAGSDPATTAALERALVSMGGGSGGGVPTTGSALQDAIGADGLLGQLPPAADGYPLDDPVSKEFAQQLSFASQLLRAEAGVRIIHVGSESAAFDTHAGHRNQQAKAWAALLPGIASFRADLESAGMADRVLIATTSEFGRRVSENSGGLDHGAASSALLMGPVVPGIHGDPSPLRDLDAAGNLKATVSFDRYLGTLATWLGVEPEQVLPSSPRRIDGLLRP